jgi:hypothetical protein
MPSSWKILAGIAAASVLATAQAWKKPVPEWTADDAHEVLTDSPWTKTVTPTMELSNDGDRGRRGGGPGGGNIGIGIPGIGGIGRPGRYPGGGYPGGGYPTGRNPGGSYPGGSYPGGDDKRESTSPPTLSLRWESALPVREAELKARETDAPTINEKYYAIAVRGVPPRMLRNGGHVLESELKKQAVLKRPGKKDVKPSSVEVHEREDGPLIIYLFPKSAEITNSDREVELDVQIERLKFGATFETAEMVYDGKLAL